MPEQQLVQLYWTEQGVAAVALDQTPEGFWITGSEARCCAPDSPEAIGALVQEVLPSGRRGVPLPEKGIKGGTRLLEVCGVKSWAQLQKNSRCVGVSAAEGVVTLTPTRNGGLSGPNRGFSELAALGLVIPPGATTAELGVAVLRAFASCSSAAQ